VHSASKLSVFTTSSQQAAALGPRAGAKDGEASATERQREKFILQGAGALCGQSSGRLITGIGRLERGELWHPGSTGCMRFLAAALGQRREDLPLYHH